jgi:hypothetical protein
MATILIATSRINSYACGPKKDIVGFKVHKVIEIPRYASGLRIGWWRKFWDE